MAIFLTVVCGLLVLALILGLFFKTEPISCGAHGESPQSKEPEVKIDMEILDLRRAQVSSFLSKLRTSSLIYSALNKKPNLTRNRDFGSWLSVISELNVFYSKKIYSSDNHSLSEHDLQRYYALVKDAYKLIKVLPVQLTYYDGVPDMIKDFEPNECFEPEVFVPWVDKAEELLEIIREFDKQIREKTSNNVKKSLNSLRFTSAMEPSAVSNGLPRVNVAELDPAQREALKHIVESFGDLPQIEAARVRRSMANIEEAQTLGENLGESTINGEKVSEMVKRIVDGNIEVLGKPEKEADREALANSLQVLDIYTKDLRASKGLGPPK